MRWQYLILGAVPLGLAALIAWQGQRIDRAFIDPPLDDTPAAGGLALPETLGAWRMAYPEWFPRERIYEKINGRDVLFFQFGVERLHCATWSGPGTWDMYLYTMREAAGARGVWLAEKPPTAQFAAEQLWATPGSAAVQHGPYYLYLSASAPDEPWEHATNLLALLCAHLPITADTTRDPAALLPRSGMRDDSLQYHANDAFGFDTLDGIHAAAYREDDDDAIWFVTVADNDRRAAALVAQYREEFTHFGGSQVFAHAHGFAGVMFDAWELIAHTNEVVYGVRDADSHHTLTQHWERLLYHLHHVLRDEE